jgi:replicative DNA helicase
MRQLPHSLEAEQALLGAMLIYPNTIKTAIETGLIPEDFFLEAHKKVFTAITAKRYGETGRWYKFDHAFE